MALAYSVVHTLLWTGVFEEWRRNYDNRSYQQHQRFYSEIEEFFPVQDHSHYGLVENFLSAKCADLPVLRILELGGWRGELASRVLRSPIAEKIQKWVNYDICPALIGKSVCHDPRYRTIISDDWFWNSDVENDFNLFISTHTIEHMKTHQLDAIVKKIAGLSEVQRLHIESPLPQTSNVSWKRYYGTHILECGWIGVRSLIERYGFDTEMTSSLTCYGTRNIR